MQYGNGFKKNADTYRFGVFFMLALQYFFGVVFTFDKRCFYIQKLHPFIRTCKRNIFDGCSIEHMLGFIA